MGLLPRVALPQRDIRRWRVRPNLLEEEGKTSNFPPEFLELLQFLL